MKFKLYLPYLIILCTCLLYQDLLAESEPNDSFEEPNTFNFLGVSFYGTIGEKGDKDYIKFTAKKGLINIKSTELPVGVNLEVILYDSDRNEIQRISDNNLIEIRQFNCLGGDYYLLIHDKDDMRFGTGRYHFTAELEKNDLFECNNRIEEAKEIEINKEFGATIQHRGDLDFYKFKIAKPGIINIDITNIPAIIIPRLVLFVENDSIVVQGNSNATSINLNHFSCDTNTIFYLLFHDSDGQGQSPDQYNFKVSLDSRDAYECNNFLQQAAHVVMGQELTASIQNKGDKDFYEFDFNAPGIINIEVSNVASNLTPTMAIYNSNRDFIKEVIGNKGDATITIEHFTCQKGKYYFYFRDYHNEEWSEQPYQFRINNLIVDSNECNETKQTATPINLKQEIKGAIQSEGDIDYYKLNIPRGVFTLDLRDIPTDITPKIEIFDPVEDVKLLDSTLKKSTPFVKIKRMICKEGKYFISIRDITGKWSYDQYKFTLTSKMVDANECNNTISTATEIKIGQTLRGYIDVKGDLDHYKFENKEAGVVNVKISTISPRIQPQISAFEKGGKLLATKTGAKGDKTISFEFATCDDPDYYLLFEDALGLGEDENMAYELVISHETLEQYECNNTFEDASSIIASNAVRAAIRPKGDLDYYKLELTMNLPYQLVVDLIPDSIDMKASLFKDDMTTLVFTREVEKGDTILQPFSVPTTGKYYIKLEDNKGENQSTSSYYLLIREKPDFIQSNLNSSFNVFPNPARDIIMIRGIETGDLVSVFDINGKKLMETNFSKVDISFLEKGIYFVRSGQRIRRFIKN